MIIAVIKLNWRLSTILLEFKFNSNKIKFNSEKWAKIKINKKNVLLISL